MKTIFSLATNFPIDYKYILIVDFHIFVIFKSFLKLSNFKLFNSL